MNTQNRRSFFKKLIAAIALLPLAAYFKPTIKRMEKLGDSGILLDVVFAVNKKRGYVMASSGCRDEKVICFKFMQDTLYAYTEKSIWAFKEHDVNYTRIYFSEETSSSRYKIYPTVSA